MSKDMALPSGTGLSSSDGAQEVAALRASIPSADEWVPVITMWQPWASLLMARRKLYETRSFRPPAKYIGKRIAIHAAAALPAERHFSEELLDLCYDAFGCGWNFSLPRGCILGTVRIGSVIATNDGMCPSIFAAHSDEKCAGDWSPNRFGWWTWDAEVLPIPIPAKGKQGWWKFPAQAIEARRAETERLGAKHESAVGSADAPHDHPPVTGEIAP